MKGAEFMSQISEILINIPHDYLEPDYVLPVSYQETYIVLMIRDPQCIYAYWEISQYTTNNFTQNFGPGSWKNSRLALRLNWNNFQQIIELKGTSNNWYIHTEDKGIPLYGELGRILPDNTFIPLAISNYLPMLKINRIKPYPKQSKLLQETLNKWEPGIFSY